MTPRQKSLSILIVLPAALLSGCGGGAQLNGSAVQIAQTLPPPTAATTSRDFTNYQIGPGDTVVVEVYGAPDLKREVEIDAAGNLSMPLVGTISAGGRRPQDVASLISAKLREGFVKDPEVTVNVVKASPKTITVDGAVQTPGIYPISGRMTLQQAIASARGAQQIADLDHVVIFRMVEDRNMAALFSLKQIRSGQSPDPQVFANDVVVVGENATRRFLRDLSQFPLLGRFVPVLL
jgi:polysaccharide export outer membrane protein